MSWYLTHLDFECSDFQISIHTAAPIQGQMLAAIWHLMIESQSSPRLAHLIIFYVDFHGNSATVELISGHFYENELLSVDI